MEANRQWEFYSKLTRVEKEIELGSTECKIRLILNARVI